MNRIPYTDQQVLAELLRNNGHRGLTARRLGIARRTVQIRLHCMGMMHRIRDGRQSNYFGKRGRA